MNLAITIAGIFAGPVRWPFTGDECGHGIEDNFTNYKTDDEFCRV